MAKIPFLFIPLPRYFSDAGWLYPENPKGLKILVWIFWTFSRCSTEFRYIHFDGKYLLLEPFEFIYGRNKCAKETGLTVDEIRTIIDNFLEAGVLEKTPNSSPNRFTTYKWNTTLFSTHVPHHLPLEPPNLSPTVAHKRNDSETKDFISMKDDSFYSSGNVHETPDGIAQNTNSQDLFLFAHQFIFVDGSKINEKVLLRWIQIYGVDEIYKALLYYQKMSDKSKITRPEAYVEECLKKRYWESDQIRIECKDREIAIQQQKEL